MRLFLGAPYRALVEASYRALGSGYQLLLPSGAARLIGDADREAHDWHGFLRALTHIAFVTHPQPEMVALLSQLCDQQLTPESYFGKVRSSPHFHNALAQNLCRWSHDGLTPDLLEQGAQTVLSMYASVAALDDDALQTEWRRKTTELVVLWRAWQHALEQAGLPEPIRLRHALLDALNNLTHAPPILLVGFTELTATDLEALRILDSKTQVAIALLYNPAHPEKYVPTDLLRRRLQDWGIQTIEEMLGQECPSHTVGLGQECPSHSGMLGQECSSHAGVLGQECPSHSGMLRQECPSHAGVLGQECPSHSGTLGQECQSHRATLGQECPSHRGMLGHSCSSYIILDTPNPLYEVETVAREVLRLRHEGVADSEMVLLLRQPESILETLETIFARYGIPLQGEVSLPLERSWRVRWLMDGMRLLAGLGEGVDWLRWLEHPAHQIDPLALRTLRRRTRRHVPASVWLESALQHADSPDLHRLLHELHELRQTLGSDLLQTARRLVLKLGEAPSGDTDLSEWLGLIDAYAHVWRQRTLTQAIGLLERLVSGARYTRRLGNDGVRLLTMEHADLVGARVVFALQVLEGTLPRRHPDDPFLRESERNALNHALHAARVYLPTRTDYQAGEPMLFQRLLHTAHERLYLSYSRTQNGDSDALPSFYLEELKVERGDALTVRFYSLEQVVPEADPLLHPYDLSLAQPSDYCVPDLYVRRAELRAFIARTERPFSVTELETLARCPFEHFARYILRLRPVKRDLSASDVGTVAHSALCRAVRQSPRRRDAQEWIEALSAQLQTVLREGAPDLPEWQAQVLHALTQRLLRRFGWREPRYQEQFEVTPVACEWAFGDPVSDDEERTLTEPPHNRHAPRPVTYTLGDGRQIPLCGVIDRIDCSPDRRVVLVVDYKLGRAPSRADFTEGRAIQGLLYLHAVQMRMPKAQVVLAYDRLKAAQRVRFVPNLPELTRRFQRLEDEDPQHCVILGLAQWRQAAQRVRDTLTQAIARLRAAIVAPTPGDHCRRCAFSDLCRQAQR